MEDIRANAVPVEAVAVRRTAASTNPEHMTGTNIKGYELLERIGTGGFGAVYRARQSTIDREVAIKIILPGWANHPDFIRSFDAEAQVIARLEHPHIVPLHDYWRDPSGAYLVMRYLRGGSVRDALREGVYDPESASKLVDQVASALDLAHRSQVIHRDVKPDNILLDEDGNAYLGDFGIARDLAGPALIHAPAHNVVGSLDYIAPEQARGEAATPQTDIYSLGVTLYEMLTGRHPFEGRSPVDMLYQHLDDPLPVLRIEGCSAATLDGTNRVIQIATAKDPAKRWPDVLSLAIALREAVGRSEAGHALQTIEQLTLREHEVLRLIAEGYTNQEIANRLFVTVATVRWHIRQLYRKLGVRSRVQATVRARELDLIVTGTVTATEEGRVAAGIISLPEPDNPYKGLRPFQAGDSADFFGRETFVARLIERLKEDHRFYRFLAIVGPSGSGKSSVMRAGLIPSLWQGKLPGSERWFVVDMLPSARPLDQLEVALVRVAASPVANLQEQLRRDSNGLLRAADLILPRDSTELVLAVDQFEELFTLVKDEGERTRFLALLYAAVTDPRSRVRVIVALRADYYDRPLHYPEFGELVRSRMETVLPLGVQGLEQAITGPARRVGVMFEPGLVSQIVAEMHYQAGALPLLQYALTELFDRRAGRLLTHAAYAQIGGAVRALANRADEILYSMTDQGRELTRQIFLRLVTMGERGENTRRRVPRSELLALDADQDLLDEIIDTFVDYRLISLDHELDTRRPMVEVAHEALLHEWECLRAWLDESRDDIQQQRLLASAAADWRQAGEDASFLLRGTRLAKFEDWSRETRMVLTAKERGFLEASLAQQAREEEGERERQTHELRLARTAVQSERRAAHRLRVLVAGLGLFLMVALGLSALALSERRSADDARQTSDANAALAATHAAAAREQSLISAAQAALSQEDLDTALALAVAANRLPNPAPEAQTILARAAYRPGTRRLFGAIQGDRSAQISIAFSADERLALFGGTDSANPVSLWDVETGDLVHRLQGHTAWVEGVEFSPDDRTAFSISMDRTIIIWDLETGAMVRRFGSDLIAGSEYVTATYSPDGRFILSNNGLSHDEADADLILWDASTGEAVRTFDGHSGFVGAVAISPDGRTALSGAAFGELIQWDLASGEIVRRFGELDEDWRKLAAAIVFRPDGHTFVVSHMDGTMALWDLDGYRVLRHFGTPIPNNYAAISLGLTADGRYALGHDSLNNHATYWNLETGARVLALPTSTLGLALTGDGARALTGGGDMRLWDLTYGAEIRRFVTDEPYQDAALSPDGASVLITTGSQERCHLTVYDVETGAARWQVAQSQAAYDRFCTLSILGFTPDRQTALIGAADDRVLLRELATGDLLGSFTGYAGPVTALALSADGHVALSADMTGLILLWDVETRQVIRHFTAHEVTISSAAIHPDGRSAATADAGGRLVWWDLTTGQEIRRTAGPGAGITAITYSPDGRALVGSVPNGEIYWWDTQSGTPQRVFRVPDSAKEGGMGAPLFTPDGRWLLAGFYSSGEIGTVQFDAVTGAVVREYPGVMARAVSLDGRRFLADSPDAIHLLRIDTQAELLAWTLANRYVRELTCDERARYQIAPPCDAAGNYPTRTPYLTPSASLAPATVAPVPPATFDASPMPSATPRPALIARLGANRGEVAVGDYQVWEYVGRAGERLTIRAEADYPANWDARDQGDPTPIGGVLDTVIVLSAPDGTTLNLYEVAGELMFNPGESQDIEVGKNTDSLIDGLVLPQDGTYRIVVSGSGYRTGGAFTLILASEPPGE